MFKSLLVTALLSSISVLTSINADAQGASISNNTVIDAKPLKRKAPKYPKSAARNQQEGWVIINFVIDIDGNVVDPFIEHSSGVNAFERSALRTVKSWKYSPAMLNGQLIEQSKRSVKLDFRMDKGVNVSKEFYLTYKQLINALGKNDLSEAKSLLNDLRNDEIWNYTESSFFWLANSLYAKAKGHTLNELSSVNRALATKNKKLMLKNILYLRGRQFLLNLSTSNYLKAYNSYQQIEKLPKNEQLKGKLAPYIKQVEVLLTSEEPLIRHAIVPNSGKLYHLLSRNRFSLNVTNGQVKTLEVRCDNKRTHFNYEAKKEWTIPEGWGQCNILLSAQEKTKVDIMETGTLVLEL